MGGQGSGVGGYPWHWEADVVLRDGGTAHIRPITPADADALQAFHTAQSPESTYLRFFAPMPRLSQSDLERFTTVDHVDRVALVLLVNDAIIGVGRYDRISAREAEVAFNVSDAHQGRGLGSVLLEHLAAAARERGIRRFTAEVLPQNGKMVSVFRDAGYEVEHAYDDGVISLGFDIDPTDRSLAVLAAREHRAEAESLRALLTPRSVVVVGASRRPESVGAVLLRNIVEGGFTGAVHAVNPEALEIQGVVSHARVTEVPAPVDLAVIAVPAEAVLDVVRDCARVGARGVVVVSRGFAETGATGLERQRELVRVAHGAGLRVVGPNSFGMINTDPAVSLNATLAPDMPQVGGLGLFSQSGALGIAVLTSAARRRLGLSTFVSAGNRADVSGNDCMQFWEEDPATAAVGVYLESIGNPRKFSRIARRLSRVKPVLAVKSGVTSYGVPPGHAVRTTRAPRGALDAMFRQAGVIRVDNIHQLFDVAQLLVHQPLPGGPRIAFVGNSEALASLVAEAALSWGLEMGIEPVTVPPEATAEEFLTAVTKVHAAHERVDGVVAVFVPPLATVPTDVARALAEVAAASPLPTVCCLLGMHGVAEELTARASDGRPRTVPAYPTPEDAVRALAAAVRYAEWRARPAGERVHPSGVDAARARALVEGWLASGSAHPSGLRLDGARVSELLACYGVPVAEQVRVTTADDAAAAAERLGYPVALKTVEPRLRHRADLGGVRLDIAREAELREDMAEMQAALGPRDARAFVVQRMVPPGVACVVRTMEDPLFGPIVSFGLAGDAVDLLDDVAHKVPPLTDLDVRDLVRGVRAAPRLFGYRGARSADIGALEDVLARVSVLADDLPEVADLELNPVLATPRGAYVLGASVRLAAPTGRTDALRRALPG
jgi:acyl-CoA synthetase (NDP forming)/GNAT superfamily N-acetyltransferase